jgi:hypothetical protein
MDENTPNLGEEIVSQLLGDSALPSGLVMGVAATIDANSNFIWSPNTNGMSALTTDDWTNGYSLTGLSSSGMSEVVSK